jgi:hypothetical protein
MTLGVESLPGGIGQVECLQVDGPTGPYIGFAIRQRSESGAWRMVYTNSTRRVFAQLDGQVDVVRSVWTSVTPARTRAQGIE